MTGENATLPPGEQNEDDIRILRKVRTRKEWPKAPPPGARVRRICIIDTETTGLDPRVDRVIEICAAIVCVDDAGRVVALEGMGTGHEDPGIPLPAAITELTGHTNESLRGKSIKRDELTAFIADCEAVVCFNSGFDRPFVEKLLPDLRPMPWGCAMADVPWRVLRFEPSAQGYLAMQAGWFFDTAHRAEDDVLTLIQLLDHVCCDGQSVMVKVLDAIDALAWRFESSPYVYSFRRHLRAHRYRWADGPDHKIFYKHVRPGEYEQELAWFTSVVGKPPTTVPLPATERYRTEDTWHPDTSAVKVAAFRR